MTFYVDTSRHGQHGIGRFSQEVVSRLNLPWTDLAHTMREPLYLDIFNPKRMILSKHDSVFVPGFNAGITRAKQYLTLHDLIHLQMPTESSPLKRIYYERIIRPAARNAGLVFTVSETSRAAIQEWLGDDDVEIVVVGNGVSPVFSKEAGSRQTGLRDYFIYVGNLKPHKNFQVLLGAMKRSKVADLVVVAPRGTTLAECQVGQDLAHRITLLSGIDDEYLSSLYRGSRGLLFPSLLEGFGLPVAEAIASGIRVAYAETCRSVHEIAKDHGIPVSEATSPEAWADAMHKLAAEPATEPNGEWLEQYSWESVANKIASKLQEYVAVRA